MRNSKEKLSDDMKRRTELEELMKSKRLTAKEQEEYASTIYRIQEHISNEDNLIY